MKRTIGLATLIALTLALAGCNWLGSIVNPIIGTWETTVLGVTVNAVFNADATCTETNSLGQVGVSRNGTWTSDATTLSKTWADGSVESYVYSFNSDNTRMTLAPSSGGLSLTYDRQ
jgi:hypothetical protein